MAAAAVEKLREMAAASAHGHGDPEGVGDVDLASPCAGETVEMSFFTAGTGNAGATIVSATFLLLCQPALTLVKGRRVETPPWSSPRAVDFGKGVGKRTVFLCLSVCHPTYDNLYPLNYFCTLDLRTVKYQIIKSYTLGALMGTSQIQYSCIFQNLLKGAASGQSRRFHRAR
jgi:hypothetical protein